MVVRREGRVSELAGSGTMRKMAMGAVAVSPLLAPAAMPDADAQTAPRPNVVHIFADDLGWNDVGYNGQDEILTPNLDGLAAGGLQMLNAYVPAAVCGPSRASLLSGLHSGHTYVDRNQDLATGFTNDHVSVADVLGSGGYDTAMFGKHGFGGEKDFNNPQIVAPDSVPTNMGYERFYGYLHHGRAHSYDVPSLWENDANAPHGVSLTSTGGQYSHDVIQQVAIDHIAQHAGGSDPFYMQVNYTIPHFDIDAIRNVPGWFDDYIGHPTIDSSGWSNDKKAYAAMITRMDHSVGEILERLADPNDDGDTSDSIAENTLVMFWSDNGPTNEDGTDVEGFFNSNGHLRGGKRDLYDGGVRVPGIVYWDGTIAPGTLDTPMDVADFLPTVADLAGAEAPVGLDGVSYAPTFTGQGIQRQRDYLIFEHHEQDSINLDGSKDPRWAILRDGVKLIEFADGSLEMYDLTGDLTGNADPDESNNIVGSHTALRDELTAIALAEGVEQPNDYAITYRQWTGSDGDRVADGAAWSGSGGPAGNWSAVLDNSGPTAAVATVDVDVNTLGFEVQGSGAQQKVIVEAGRTLTGRNEIRIDGGGTIELQDATLDTVRWVDVKDGGKLTGLGLVNGDIYNAGTVRPGLDATPTTPPPAGLPTAVVDAIDFDFTGTQNAAPLNNAQTSQYLQLVSGLNLGAGLEFKDGATNAGDEFDVAGFEAGSSLANAIAADDYLGFTVAPVAGVAIELDSVTFDLWRNGVNAATDYAILTSIDGFTDGAELGQLNNVTDEGIANTSVFTAAYTGGQQVEGSLEVRLYGWGAQLTGNTHFNAVSMDARFVSVADEPLSPIGPLTLNGDYYQLDDGRLQVDLAADGNDQLIVTESASLAGSLEVELADGFTPLTPDVTVGGAGDQFTILTADTLSGTFDTVTGLNYDDLAETGRELRIDYTDTDVLLTAYQYVAGDTDFDLQVDSGDIQSILIAGKFGIGFSDATWAEGDFDNDGDVDATDIQLILIAGQFSQSTHAAIAAIPEPASFTLLSIGSLLLTRRRGRKRTPS